MGGVLGKARGDSQQSCGIAGGRGLQVGERGDAFGQSAGFIQQKNIEVMRSFQCGGIFDQNTFACGKPGRHHDCRGGGQTECTRTGDDEH